MFLNRRLLPLSVFALTAGLLTGIVPFYTEFSLLQHYTIQVGIVYAYFKTYNANVNATGLSGSELISCVFVLNITNPTSETIGMTDVTVDFVQSARKDPEKIIMENETIQYERSFADHVIEYYWFPNSTRLIALTATGELSDLGRGALESGKGYFLAHLMGRTEIGALASSDFVLKEASLETVSDNEYVYNSVFMKDYRFHFRNDEISISLEW